MLAFDQSTVSRWGHQVGARYFVTGKVFANDERQNDERRVQYTLFMQVLDAETGEVLFQNKPDPLIRRRTPVRSGNSLTRSVNVSGPRELLMTTS